MSVARHATNVASATADVSYVFAATTGLDRLAVRLAVVIDAAFLAEVGWNAAAVVLCPPPEHPLLGRPVCRAQGCSTTAPSRARICASCRRRLAAQGMVDEDVDRLPARIEPAAAFDPPAVCDPCAVAACGRRRRHRDGRYCEAHQQRLRLAHGRDPELDEQRWRLTEAPVGRGGQISLRGLSAVVVAEVLVGLQQRSRLDGVKTKEADLRALCNQLRHQQVARLGDVVLAGNPDGGLQALCNAVTAHARRALATPETEVVNDEWDLVVFGHAGTLSFTAISQPWLREVAQRWAADDLPKRRSTTRKVGLAVRHHLGCVARLSQSLRMRPDRGEIPAALGRRDMEAFLHRLAYQQSAGQLSADARIRACREVRKVLTTARAMGLTRPGGPAGGLGEDFTIGRHDVPDEPEAAEPGRDLPVEIMRQLCAQLDGLASPAMRTGVELAIDTGRRPEELCTLPFDCLSRDDDGLPVLIYDNHKANRPGRRLPIAETTAQLITDQKERVRARYPHTPVGELKLLPTDRRNPAGRKAITAFSLAFAHRAWVARMPVLATVDGAEFDKRKIVLYAYRHSYAQRHADAGVGIDVLRELMDHRKLDATKGYYRVGENRLREAVDRVAAMQFDRHGKRIWRAAQQLLDSEHVRRAIGEVAVPFGVCAEPSNVQAGGNACPFRFRCVGCDHFRTDVSYLPDLQAYLDDLLRNRERVLAATDIDGWARTEAMPSEEEISRVRRLIARITAGLDDLSPEEHAEVERAVDAVRRHRTAMLGMLRIRQPLPVLPPQRTA